jgi:hypothetical protein
MELEARDITFKNSKTITNPLFQKKSCPQERRGQTIDTEQFMQVLSSEKVTKFIFNRTFYTLENKTL